MITFTKVGKVIKVSYEGKDLPPTLIQCDGNEEVVLKTCQDWLDTLGLTDVEYQVFIKLH